MQSTARPRLRRASAFALFALSAALLAACAAPPQPKAMVNKKPRSKEYFSESEYGVKASPRVTFKMSGLQRGGGRDQLGKPYQVRGKWYYPKEDKRYAKMGLASWYGEAFHGRLTANGEVYDMTHLTGAHPTMPLPSYARVTNLKTGSSIIVRVNDRGPYHEGRIIDVSKRAAEMLDYANIGTAKVKVEYVGRAPLDGNDDRYLMASYNPGNRVPDPSDGLPSGVMIAMDGPSPSTALVAAAPFPGQLTNSASAQPVIAAQAPASGNVTLPDFGPIVPERPQINLPAQSPFSVASLSYADERVQRASNVFAALDGAGMSPAEILRSWKRQTPPAASATSYIAAGSFEDTAEAQRVAARLSSFGKTEIERSEFEGKDWYSVNLYPDGHGSLDEMLQAAWSHGAPDALVVRN
ncbi:MULTISPECIES: septal ring lytic transglycosylase RlpA family protein [unclassified Mesorhizobium]|uniref:septal ring lytic transglycosylase RlpA family protein n=1 Tax=unclassified Mesorhizobium TaxID=325217 RepID=UPI000FD5DE5D|nr:MULTISPECIES: septal ring lytic transglycosylase RlpA family protein [unclassified Mesorhizobium]RUV81339.1 septal ring lytic transglycosylase RlpA family protein [Mesorhizobium sp. M5C.F.Ca.IN.020.14.1.1]RUV30567.1 septal ring lytic transglycosylase RlpA family protein [Mesorhizobium sp. M5C.F.Ca.IN.020.32.2.1]RWG48796.1 MAG: septal ring lytic transglycosylase RlpA family protein [Mesorhizobium sp.]RWH51363.1 MAG: septal ring lytic transglycosylase RlpA family protein [Mesorhizobium sp.]RW